MTQTPTPRTDAEEGAIFAAFSEDRISAKQAIRAMAAESRRHEREAACRPSPVVISEMETPTPEMDAFERDIIACIPEELHQLQAYARKGRELETRLTAAEAEIAVMRSGEVVAWMNPQTGNAISEKSKRPTSPLDAHYTIPLYRSPAPVVMPEGVREAVIEAVAEALGDAYDCIRVWDAWSYGTMGPDDFVSVAGQADRLAEIADAAISAHIRSLSSPAPVEGLPVAAHDVLAERERQKAVEGWTEAHDDDQHQNCELAEAASGYIQAYLFPGQFKPGMPSPAGWPWNESWWKPKDQRRNLVRAGALIIAEIERIDRATLTGQAKKGG